MPTLTRPACALAILSLVWAGCDNKNKTEGDATLDSPLDTLEVTDGADLDDSQPDTTGDPTADVPDAETDAETDTTLDAEDAHEVEDCVPDGSVGVDPSDGTAACAKVAACVAPSAPADSAASCMTFGLLGGWQPLYGRARDLQIVDGLNQLWQVVMDNAADVAAASDCDEVFRVLNSGTPSDTCTLLSASFPAWPTGCRGGDLVYCVNVDPTNTDGREVVVSCGTGTSCQTVMGVMSACFIADCTVRDEDAVCRDGNIDQCVSPGRHLVLDCDALARGAGGVCEMIDDGSGTGALTAGCVPTGAACDESTFTNSCSEDLLTRCAQGHEFVTDCTDIGAEWLCSGVSRECIPDVTTWTCTTPRGGLCDCDDLVFCDATVGADVRLDCSEYGMSCAEDTDGAMCVP